MKRYRIGRGSANDIVVPEQTVSREHAELCELGDGRFSIKDLGSTYGTAVLEGDQWTAVTEAELKIETRLRLGEFETSVAELLDIADHTLVPAKVAATPPPRTAAPAAQPAKPAVPPAPTRPPAPAPARTAAPTEVPVAPPVSPRPAPPRPPRTAAPTEVPATAPTPPRALPPRPAPPRAPRSAEQTEVPAAAAPRPSRPAPAPAAPRQPAFQFLRDMPKEKRVLVMLAGGFGVFLVISLIVLVLALALG